MGDRMLGKLPDVMAFDNGGGRVKCAADWQRRRREIIDGAVKLCYGGMPPEPEYFELRQLCGGGPGKCDSYRIITGTKERQLSIYLKIYRPECSGKTPVLLDGDGCWGYITSDVINAVRARGYALAVFDRTEVVRDIWHDPEPRNCPIYEIYPGLGSGTIACWAWSILRCVDALTQMECIDAENIAVAGHSRGGKTAMLAGAMDERIRFTQANGSGAGGCGCFHYLTLEPEEWQKPCAPERSERMEDLFQNFPNWLGQDMRQYCGRDGELPFDQHFFKALVAPRYFIHTEGYSDVWANPKGSRLTTLAAQEVYRLLGAEGRIFSHYREGGHFHRLSDFELLLSLMDHIISGAELSEEFRQDAFPEMSRYL